MHTPGPWGIRVGTSSHVSIDQQGTNKNVAVGIHPDDAAVLVAAPEMFEALKHAVAVYGELRPKDGATRETLNAYMQMVAALAWVKKAQDGLDKTRTVRRAIR